MSRKDDPLNGQEWMIWGMNSNEWFIEWAGMNDSWYEQE